MQIDFPQRSFTRRGILSIINSLYDPIGLISPVVLQGRFIQRELLLPKDNSESMLHALSLDDKRLINIETDGSNGKAPYPC